MNLGQSPSNWESSNRNSLIECLLICISRCSRINTKLTLLFLKRWEASYHPSIFPFLTISAIRYSKRLFLTRRDWSYAQGRGLFLLTENLISLHASATSPWGIWRVLLREEPSKSATLPSLQTPWTTFKRIALISLKTNVRCCCLSLQLMRQQINLFSSAQTLRLKVKKCHLALLPSSCWIAGLKS